MRRSLLASLLLASSLGAQTPAARLAPQVRAWRQAHEPQLLREFAELLAIPNLASDSANIRRNARWIVDAFAKRGVALRTLESPSGGPPVVFGELRTPGATRTVVLYAHYDGQPVDRAQWASDPWTPTLRDAPLEQNGKVVPLPDRSGVAGDEWRLYARSAGDDKAPILAALAALDAMQAVGARPSVNLKFFFEGEEEAGSPHLRALLERHRAELDADAWLFADGPVHQSRRQQIVYGARGVMGLDVTVYGPLRALHSGHYGNWAPNPIPALAEIVASMRDSDGNIRIAGFLDDVRKPGDDERRAIAAAPAPDAALRDELALGRVEGGGALLAERIMLPALNLRGIRGGAVGAGAANAVPTEATASIDFRLVPGQTPPRVRELVEGHLASLGYTVVHEKPDAAARRRTPKLAFLQWEGGYPALRTPLDAPIARAVVQVARETAGTPPVEVPLLGGSLPLNDFAEVLKKPILVVPIANHDDAQHAANENLRLRNLWDGIELFAGLFTGLGPAWR